MNPIFSGVNRGIIFRSFGRLALISSAAFGLATISNWEKYNNYWHETIYRVQTVDFNILAHTLPTKLSAALIAEEPEEIQQTINSNYGLSGIVVTDCKIAAKDCPEQKILYLSASNLSWKQNLQLADLPSHPYDLLRNPPPLLSESKYASPQATEIELTGKTNPGEIIGRVYYVRGIAPRFVTDYTSWLLEPWSNSGARKYYSLTVELFFSGGFAAWVIIEALLYRKRLQQKQAQAELERLQRELQETTLQIPKRIAQKEQALTEVGHRLAEKEEQIKELQAEIGQYESQLTEKEEQQQERAQILEQLQKELAEMQMSQTEVQEGIEEREQAITDLKKQIETSETRKRKISQIRQELQQKLQITEQQKQEFGDQVQEQREVIESFKQQLKNAQQRSQLLEEQLVNNSYANQLLAARIDSDNYYFQEYCSLEIKFEELKRHYGETYIILCDREDQVNEYRQESSRVSTSIDLSEIRLGLVGGHQRTRSGVQTKLWEYGLRSCQEISSTLSQQTIKEKLSNCNLIVLITGYMGHDLSESVMSLQEKGALTGKILRLPTRCNGRSSVVREILAYLESQGR